MPIVMMTEVPEGSDVTSLKESFAAAGTVKFIELVRHSFRANTQPIHSQHTASKEQMT